MFGVQKSSPGARLACKHVANIQDMTRRYEKAPDDTKRAADLDWIAPGGTRSHPATRPSPNFKTRDRVQTRWRVRFPSASATRGFGSPVPLIRGSRPQFTRLKNRCRVARVRRAADRDGDLSFSSRPEPERISGMAYSPDEGRLRKEGLMSTTEPSYPGQPPVPPSTTRPRNGLGVAALVIGGGQRRRGRLLPPVPARPHRWVGRPDPRDHRAHPGEDEGGHQSGSGHRRCDLQCDRADHRHRPERARRNLGRSQHRGLHQVRQVHRPGGQQDRGLDLHRSFRERGPSLGRRT
jgi:hypothetical protein